MLIEGFRKRWNVSTEEELVAVLASRDARGGLDLWLSEAERSHPCLAVWISGAYAAVHCFPVDGQPGFRCLGVDLQLPPEETTNFVFEGCDPWSGEVVPNEFVLSLAELEAVAKHFLRSQSMSPSHPWFEL